jgi:hypothetical protein
MPREALVHRVVDAGSRRLPLRRESAAGLTAAEFRKQCETGSISHVGPPESVTVVADGLGWEPAQVLKHASRGFRARRLPPAASLPEEAFRYVLANPAVSSALVGTGKLSNLRRAVENAAGGPLSAALMAGIRTVQVPDVNLLNPATWEIKEKYGDKR